MLIHETTGAATLRDVAHLRGLEAAEIIAELEPIIFDEFLSDEVTASNRQLVSEVVRSYVLRELG